MYVKTHSRCDMVRKTSAADDVQNSFVTCVNRKKKTRKIVGGGGSHHIFLISSCDINEKRMISSRNDGIYVHD
jgi:gluconate kinase